jgi:hypothetical protein
VRRITARDITQGRNAVNFVERRIGEGSVGLRSKRLGSRRIASEVGLSSAPRVTEDARGELSLLIDQCPGGLSGKIDFEKAE